MPNTGYTHMARVLTLRVVQWMGDRPLLTIEIAKES
jgi:hypothetical protein